MEIIPLNGNVIKPNTVAAIGFFDGVHLAHETLIKTMKAYAETHSMSTAVITFDVHPKAVLFDLPYRYITPLKKKLELIETHGIDTLYLIEFDEAKASMKPDAFIEQYLNRLDVIVCGFDFRFGHRGSGSVSTLKNHPEIKTIVVDELTHDGYKIGSTHIRDLIMAGRVGEVKETLGRYHTVAGTVIEGAKKGREIGYPTANIDTGDYLIPKQGVYASFTRRSKRWYPSMSTVGHNPTLNKRHDLSVESHLFDFDEIIYGETIEIAFVERLRSEIAFDSAAALIEQIKEDERQTHGILKSKDFPLH